MGIIINGQNDTIGPVDNSMSLLGTVSIGGTMTIEDFTNIDSVGLITARNGLQVTGGNVGINEASPDSKFHVNSGVETVPARFESTGTQSRIGFKASGTPTSYHVACGAEANNFIVYTNNTEKLRITSGGNLGIKNTSPNNTLTVGDTVQPSYAPSSAGNYIEIARTSGADAGLLINKNTGQWLVGIDNSDGANSPLRFEYGAAGSAHPGFGSVNPAMIIKHDGKIGIGTDNPLNGLDILQSSSRTRVTSFGHIITQNHVHGTTNYWSIAPRNGGELDIAYGSPDGNGTVTSDKLTITPAGKILVGTTSSSGDHILEVNSGTDNEGIKVVSTDAGSYIRFADNSTTAQIRLGAVGNDFKIDVNASERLRITSDGKVGINETSPTALLDINHPNTEQGLKVRSRYGNINTAMVKFDADPDSNGGDGNVLHLHGGSSRTDSEILHVNSTGEGTCFQIRGDGRTRVYKQLQLEHASNVPKIIFNEYGANDIKAQIEMDQVSGSAGQLIFRTQDSGTLSERLRIGAAGQLAGLEPGGGAPQIINNADVNLGGRYIWNRISSSNHVTTTTSNQFRIAYYRSSSGGHTNCYYRGVNIKIHAGGRYDWGGHGFVTYVGELLQTFYDNTSGRTHIITNEGYSFLQNNSNNMRFVDTIWTYDSNYLYGTLRFNSNESGTGWKPYYNIEIIDTDGVVHSVIGV